MVTETKTQVSESETPASETAAPASEAPVQEQAGQQPQETEQRTEESPEKGPVDAFWETLSPEARAEFLKRVPAEELHQHPEYQEQLRREQQRARDTAISKQREADRLRGEEDAIQQSHRDAERALDEATKEGDAEKLPRLARQLAEAKARAEYWPPMRDAIFRVPDRAPYGDQMTPDEKAAFSERQGEVGVQIEHSFRVYGESVARIATAAAEERLKGDKAKGEKAAFELGKSEALREARGEAPPRTPAGAPTPGGTDADRLARIASGTGTDDDKRWYNERYRRPQPASRGA